MVPDMLTFAKGVGNGLALAGVVARADVMDSLPANSISTFGGNPLSTAGALANLDFLLSHDLQGNALKIGHLFFERLRPLAERHAYVAEVRGKGLMLAIELCRPDGQLTPWPEAAAALMEACKRRGLLIGKGGLYGNVLRIAPPLSITPGEAAEGLDILEAAIEEVGGES
jgi:4-aminobutyrate aminotransferase